jgi:hypothetical protein
MEQSTKPEEPNQRTARRLWHYEHTTPLHGAKDRNGNEIVITTAAVYDLDSHVLIVECFTPTGNERTIVDCSVWRGPCGAPGAGAAIRALAEFEDCVLASVRAWARLQRLERDGMDQRAREAAGESES